MTLEDTSDLGTGLEAELVSAHERCRRVRAPRRLDEIHELRRTDIRERVERPRLRLTTESVNGAR
jgi:hypothetical protein